MFKNLTFLEDGRFTQKDETVKAAAKKASGRRKTPWGSISRYLEQELEGDTSNKKGEFRKRAV